MTVWEDLRNEATAAHEQATALAQGAADLTAQSEAARCRCVESRTNLRCGLDVHGEDVEHDLRSQLTWPG